MKFIILLSLFGLFACTTRSVEETPGHAANSAGSATQEPANGHRYVQPVVTP